MTFVDQEDPSFFLHIHSESYWFEAELILDFGIQYIRIDDGYKGVFEILRRVENGHDIIETKPNFPAMKTTS